MQTVTALAYAELRIELDGDDPRARVFILKHAQFTTNIIYALQLPGVGVIPGDNPCRVKITSNNWTGALQHVVRTIRHYVPLGTVSSSSPDITSALVHIVC